MTTTWWPRTRPEAPVPTHVLYVTKVEYRAIMRAIEARLAGKRFGSFEEGKPVDLLIDVIRAELGVDVPSVVFGVEIVEEVPAERFQELL